MTVEETTYTRPSEYSLFHRTIKDGCYALDIDWVEWRQGRGVVALICTTGRLIDEKHLINSLPIIKNRIKFELKVITEISKKLGVKAYYVMHTKSLDLFYVYEIVEGELKNLIKRTNEQYVEFIKGL